MVLLIHPIWVFHKPTCATHTDQVYMWHHEVLTKHPFKAGCLITPSRGVLLHPIFLTVYSWTQNFIIWFAVIRGANDVLNFLTDWMGKFYFCLLQCLLLIPPSSYVAGNLQSALNEVRASLPSRYLAFKVFLVDGQHWFCCSQCYGYQQPWLIYLLSLSLPLSILLYMAIQFFVVYMEATVGQNERLS